MPALVRAHGDSFDIDFDRFESQVVKPGFKASFMSCPYLVERDVSPQGRLDGEALALLDVRLNEGSKPTIYLGTNAWWDFLEAAISSALKKSMPRSRTGKRVDFPLPGGPPITIITGRIRSLRAYRWADPS